jgi:hypothetical protein
MRTAFALLLLSTSLPAAEADGTLVSIDRKRNLLTVRVDAAVARFSYPDTLRVTFKPDRKGELLDLKAGQLIRVTHKGPVASAVLVLTDRAPKPPRTVDLMMEDWRVGLVGVIRDSSRIEVEQVLTPDEMLVFPTRSRRAFLMKGVPTKDLADGSRVETADLVFKIAATRERFGSTYLVFEVQR